MSVGIVLTPPMLVLIALLLGIAADRARAGARDSGLLSLRIGTVALFVHGLLTGLIALLLAMIVVAESVGVNPFEFVPTFWVALNLCGAACAIALLLDGATLATGLYWEYGRAVAWWRERSGPLSWLVHAPRHGGTEPPPISQRAIPRRGGVALAVPMLAGAAGLLLADEFAPVLLMVGDPLVWGTVGVPLLEGLAFLVLALTVGDRSQPDARLPRSSEGGAADPSGAAGGGAGDAASERLRPSLRAHGTRFLLLGVAILALWGLILLPLSRCLPHR